ncbi:hypothetical protein GJ744_010757 [Endocarpon pusillum]|uniref:Uncharacterized protein n=1 Tax=Endocarpon pusillum TaxID=364733 RepID=A0A8H7AE94_9EURO|nr:hypothetical protein GJ744_010757 [Endocarpon pusillum]
MDQILKARKMGSAVARRRKLKEREIAMQQDEERRTRILLYGYSSEEDESSDEEGNSYPPISDTQSDRLRPCSRLSTASRPSSATASKSPPRHAQPSGLPSPSSITSKSCLPQLVIPPPLSPNFATFQTESIPLSDNADEQLFFTEPETPLEIATPILYSIPHTRPSMISIKTQSKLDTLQRPASMPHPPAIPMKSEKRISATSLRSASSPVELPTVSSHSLSRDIFNKVTGAEKETGRRRPITVSAKSESALQHRSPRYDVFPRRSKVATAHKVERPRIHEEQAPTSATRIPQILINTKRSSFTVIAKDSESAQGMSPPTELYTKESTSTLPKRRASIGLALRTASAPFRSKNTNSRPPTSSSSESVASKDSINFSAFPMPPPSPLCVSHSTQHQNIRERSGGSSRIRQVRTIVGL